MHCSVDQVFTFVMETSQQDNKHEKKNDKEDDKKGNKTVAIMVNKIQPIGGSVVYHVMAVLTNYQQSYINVALVVSSKAVWSSNNTK